MLNEIGFSLLMKPATEIAFSGGFFRWFFFLIRSFFVCDFIFARFPFNTDQSLKVFLIYFIFYFLSLPSSFHLFFSYFSLLIDAVLIFTVSDGLGMKRERKKNRMYGRTRVYIYSKYIECGGWGKKSILYWIFDFFLFSDKSKAT